MLTIGIDKAKAQISQLLLRVGKGEVIEITRQGKPFAKMIPSTPKKANVAKAIKQMEAFQRRGPVLGPDLTLKQLIEEGRKR